MHWGLGKMRLMLGLVVLAASIGAAAAQTTKYGVTVTPEKNVDYTKFHSYSWRRGQPSADKTIDAQIIAAIDRELATIGMKKIESGPSDVAVAYGSLTRTDVNLKAKPDAKGTLPQYPVGTLVVTMSDPASDRRLLRMRVDLPIDIQPGQLESSINQAVAMMFAEYPTRRRK